MMDYDDVGLKSGEDIIKCLEKGNKAYDIQKLLGGRVSGLLADALDLVFQQRLLYQWRDYLAQLPSLGIAEGHASEIRSLWFDLHKALPQLAVPYAASSEDGEIFQLAWDSGKHHLDIDVMANGIIEWFYRNRSNEERDLGETIEGAIKHLDRMYQ